MGGASLCVALAAFLTAIFAATLMEYGGHRLMHARWLLALRHAEHHRDGSGQGVLGEFIDYLLGAIGILWVGFLHSIEAGLGTILGGITYCILAAYSHQVQHERPELVFWLKRPIHYLHHTHHMWRHNFGILVDFWDRLFDTYKVVEWNPERPPLDHPLRAFFEIKWR